MMMKRIQYISLLATLLFSACILEEIPDNKQESKNIELLLSVPNYRMIATTKSATRATADGTTAEQTVSNLYLFLFPTASGQSLVKHYIANTGDFTVGNWTGTKVSLNMTQVEAGKRNVYIVANFDGGLKNKLDTVQTLAGLQNVFGSSDTPWSPTFTTPILMSGSKAAHDFKAERVLGSGVVDGPNEPLRLTRALARIELHITLKDVHKSAQIADYKYKYTNFHKETNVIKKATSTGSDKYASSSASVWPNTTGWTLWGSALDAQGIGSAYTASGGVVTTLQLVTYVNERDGAGAAIEIEVPYNGTGPLPPPEFGPELYKLEFPEGITRNYWYVHEIEI